MQSTRPNSLILAFAILANFMPGVSGMAQPAAAAPGRGRGPQGPQVISPEVSAGRHVTFRLLAQKAQSVRLNRGDIPGNGQGAEMTQDTNGIWAVTLGPIGPGAYRYNFGLDGVLVIDPRNPA